MREKMIKFIWDCRLKCTNHLCVDCEKLADHLIANGVTVQKWIPVTERLPEKDGKFIVHKLIFGSVSTMSVCGFANDGETVNKYDMEGKKNVWYEYDSEVGYFEVGSVTHWMPLPEPPKGE